MLPAGYRPATSWVHYTTSCNTQSSAPEDGQNNFPKHVELNGIINKTLLHLVGCLYYLYQWCTVKQISDNEIYLLIKYTKSVLWRRGERLSYIQDARCLKVNLNNNILYPSTGVPQPQLWRHDWRTHKGRRTWNKGTSRGENIFHFWVSIVTKLLVGHPKKFEVRFPVGITNSPTVLPGSGVHPATYSTRTSDFNSRQ